MELNICLSNLVFKLIIKPGGPSTQCTVEELT